MQTIVVQTPPPPPPRTPFAGVLVQHGGGDFEAIEDSIIQSWIDALYFADEFEGLECEEASYLQINALYCKLKVGGDPSVCMGVFTMFGSRHQTEQSFSAEIFVAGERVQKRIHGPQNYPQWLVN